MTILYGIGICCLVLGIWTTGFFVGIGVGRRLWENTDE